MKQVQISRVEYEDQSELKARVFLTDGSELTGLISANSTASVNAVTTAKIEAILHRPDADA